jgi:hypothetical protein
MTEETKPAGREHVKGKPRTSISVTWKGYSLLINSGINLA